MCSEHTSAIDEVIAEYDKYREDGALHAVLRNDELLSVIELRQKAYMELLDRIKKAQSIAAESDKLPGGASKHGTDRRIVFGCDCRSVRWGEEMFTFTAKQAAAVKTVAMPPVMALTSTS